MQTFDWNLIKSFLAVAETGSLSAGARRLSASQPTLGRHIAELEAELGVTLFERVPRGMVLTDAGARLLEHGQKIATDTAALSLAASGASQEIAGSVRITASQIVCHFLLPPIIVRLREAEPALQIEIVSTDTVQNLLTRDADIAIRMVEPAQQELIVRKVNEAAVGLFAAPSYLERHGAPKEPPDIFDHVLIGLDRDDLMIRGITAAGFAVTRNNFAVRTDDQVLYWRLVEAGVGIGFGQLYAAMKMGTVERVVPDLPIAPLPMYIAAHRELRTSLRVRRAYDFLADALAALPLAEDAVTA